MDEEQQKIIMMPHKISSIPWFFHIMKYFEKMTSYILFYEGKSNKCM